MFKRVASCHPAPHRRQWAPKLIRALIAVGLLGAALVATADTAYVTDQGEFNLRSGESTSHKIIRVLPSGASVQVLSKDRETGYSRVRTEDGTTGFLLTRYLQDDPAARVQLAETRARLDELQQEPDQLAAKLSRIEEEHQALQQEHQTVSERNIELEEALAVFEHTSENIVNINEERNQLQKDVAKLTRTVGELEQENLDLRSGDDRRWFLTGAGVAGGGLIIGLFLASAGIGRRRSGSRDLF
ncbi:TIGR04211 family SH3 domain-containing protein [Thiorhodovibrio frisius]|uniref:SH3 domain protein n=1 Tax=Thiorhodovibrio frisius TaxID=631362 RepID=H8YY88_9GAMM|nr:TIGR04211 family SH3 domain-containing protein [Thiorhodovibrio frisius]EIC23414.1 SH3 domain protein [Thiorhodovibrio frisius]WPL23504.1 SH3 domain-containing protein [Thiorhodovibrio frisius]